VFGSSHKIRSTCGASFSKEKKRMELVSLPDSPARWLREISAGQEWRWAAELA